MAISRATPAKSRPDRNPTIPPDEKNDKALTMAEELLRGT